MADPLANSAEFKESHSFDPSSSGVTLERWSDTLLPDTENIDLNDDERSPFRWSSEINSKVYLCFGQASKLSCDAVVHRTNENLDEDDLLSRELLSEGGPAFRRACKEIRPCRAGEVKVSPGFNLPSRLVFHTVGPRFNIKYRTAAQSALYNCYRTVLQTAVENEATALAIPPIHSRSRNYPPVDGAHLGLRTIRRFLEKHGHYFSAIILVLDEHDRPHYEGLLPMYFPRSLKEEQFSKSRLPKDIGNENGEPVVEDRKIRIAEAPRPRHDSENDDMGYLNRPDFDARQLAVMSPTMDMDRVRVAAIRQSNIDPETATYQKWLLRSRAMNFDTIEQYELIRIAGRDHVGRPIVQILGRNFRPDQIRRDELLCYLFHVLDEIVNEQYVVLYFHTDTTSDNHPSPAFMKTFYSIAAKKYRKNLRSCLIVHPTFWTKVMTWFFSTFTVSDIKSKLHHITELNDLSYHMSPEQADVPKYVIDHDHKVNKSNYPQSSTGHDL